MILFFEDHPESLFPLALGRGISSLKVGVYSLEEYFTLHKKKTSTFNSHLIKEQRKDISLAVIKPCQTYIHSHLIPNLTNLTKIQPVLGNSPIAIWSEKQLIAVRLEKETQIKSTKDLFKIARTIKNKIVDNFSLLTKPHEIITYGNSLLKEQINHKIKLIGEKKFNKKFLKNIFIGKNTTIHPSVIINSNHGPVVIESGVRIEAFVCLKGPLWIGKNSLINHHSVISNCSIGSFVKIGGEVMNTIIDDFSNKAHYGFLGHSYIGKWVNIGAGTTTSNLKNNYKLINYRDYQGQLIKTDETFIGSMIGDHTKVGINTSISPGTLIGFGASISGNIEENIGNFKIFPHPILKNDYAKKKTKSSFTQTTKKINLESFLATKVKVMARRNIIDHDDQKYIKNIYHL